MKIGRQDRKAKLLRAFALVIGIVATGITGYRVYGTLQVMRPVRLVAVWPHLFTWQRLLTVLPNALAGSWRLRAIEYVQLGVHAGAIAVAILLAPLLDRSRLGWGVLSVLFPYAGPTVLGFLRRAQIGHGHRRAPSRFTELHIVALVVAIAVIAATGYQAYGITRGPIPRARDSALWAQIVFMWARSITALAQQVSRGLFGIAPLQLVFVNLHVAAVVVSIMLAQALNRSRLDFAVLSALLPYVAPLVLAFQSRKDSPQKGWIQRFFSAVFSATGQGGWVSQRKQCGRCGKQVPLSARAGQRCPHCGARWSAERTIQR